MTYGLKRLTNAANRIEAWKDWDREKERAWSLGLGNLVARYAPRPGYGWKRIDDCTAALRTAISAALADEKVRAATPEQP